MGIEIQNVMAFVMMDLVQCGRGHHLSESHARTVTGTWNQAKSVGIPPPGQKNSLFSVWPNPPYVSKGTTSKLCVRLRTRRRAETRADQTKTKFMTTNPTGDENHTFSLSTGKSSKNQPFFKWNQGDVRFSGKVVLHYFWRGFAKIFILSCGIAVFQDEMVFVFLPVW